MIQLEMLRKGGIDTSLIKIASNCHIITRDHLSEDEKDQKIEHVEDLQSDPILIWQDKHIFKIGGFAGIILPGLVGIILIGGFSGFLGGLIWGGLLRLVIVHHGTFLINSGAHYWGKQNYSTKNIEVKNFDFLFFFFK